MSCEEKPPSPSRASRIRGEQNLIQQCSVTRFPVAGAGEETLPGLVITRDSPSGQVRVSWQSEEGVAYRLQQSEDLVNWTDIGDGFTGDGSVLEHLADPVTDGRRFFRLAKD